MRPALLALSLAVKLHAMPHLPDFETFARLAKEHSLVPVYRRLLSDALTPVSAFHQIDTGGSACLFESVIGGEKVGRYSFLTAGPFLLLEALGRSVRITEFPAGKPPVVRAAPVQFVVEYMFSTKVAVSPVGATSNLTLPSVKLADAAPDKGPVATTR